MNRTPRQNASLHLGFEKLAESLNDAGYDVRKVLREDVSLDWTPSLVKEILYKSIMRAMYEKSSTADLTTVELQKVWDVMGRHLAEKFGIEAVYPSIDSILEEERNREYLR